MQHFNLDNSAVVEIAAMATFGVNPHAPSSADSATRFILHELPGASVENRSRSIARSILPHDNQREPWIVRAWPVNRTYCLQLQPRRLSVSFVKVSPRVPSFSLIQPVFARHLDAYKSAFQFGGTRRVALEYVDDVELPDDNFEKYLAIHTTIPPDLANVRSSRMELKWEEAPFVDSLEIERSGFGGRQVRLSWLASATFNVENTVGETMKHLDMCHEILRKRFSKMFTPAAMRIFHREG